MNINIDYIISCIVGAMTVLYITWKLFNSPKNISKIKIGLALVVETLFVMLLFSCIDSFLRIILNCMIFTIINKYIFEAKWSKSLFCTCASLIIITISEIIFGIIFFLILKVDVVYYYENFAANTIANFIIAALSILVISNKRIFNLIIGCVDKLDKKIQMSAIMCSLILLITLIISLNLIYIKVSPLLSLIMIMITFLFYSLIMFSLIKEKQENIKANVKFEAALKDLAEYEKLLDDQRAKFHDNNNDWITVQGMLKDDELNKEAIEYIGQILKDNKKRDKHILSKTSIIPYGGLQGLVYKKLLKMKEKGINYTLNLSNELKKKKLLKFDAGKNKRVCTIIGIFLDNAIEAAVESISKEIAFSMHIDEDMLFIKISNTYVGLIDISKIDERKYSTKGTGRGYGLSNVKEIVTKCDYLVNEREINGKYFTQVLKIKM